MTAADEMRRAFDRSFAEAPGVRRDQGDDFLAIGLGSRPYALRLHGIAGLFADKRITAVPTPVAELLGVAGFRGEAVPVYDLQALVGLARDEAARWMVLLSGKPPLALAFGRFDGHFRATRDAIAVESAAGRTASALEVVHWDGAARPIVDVSSLREGITRRAQQHRAPQRER